MRFWFSLFKEYTNLKANNLMLYVENFIRTESSRIGNIATCICKRLDPWRKYNLCVCNLYQNKKYYLIKLLCCKQVCEGWSSGWLCEWALPAFHWIFHFLWSYWGNDFESVILLLVYEKEDQTYSLYIIKLPQNYLHIRTKMLYQFW